MISPPQRILIVRLSAIGDVVHALPALHALRAAFPAARIGWVVEELSATLLRGHPEIDALFAIPKKRWRQAPWRTRLAGEQRAFWRDVAAAGPWDAAVDFQGLTKSGLAAWRSGARQRIGFAGEDSREVNRLFMTERVAPPPEAQHVVRKNLSLLAPLGLADAWRTSWPACRFPDFSEERAELTPFLETLGGAPFVALYPGAGWETKRWPEAHFATLARLLADEGAPPLVLVWGPGEEERMCRRIHEAAGLNDARLRLAPPTNLRRLAALLAEAAVVVGGDTGPVHLAAALERPVVGLYGGSDPVRNGPLGRRATALLAKSASCTICWKTECRHTPRLDCLQRLAPQHVAEAVRRALV